MDCTLKNGLIVRDQPQTTALDDTRVVGLALRFKKSIKAYTPLTTQSGSSGTVSSFFIAEPMA